MHYTYKFILRNFDLNTQLVLDNVDDDTYPKNYNDFNFSYKRTLNNLTEIRQFSDFVVFILNGKRFIDIAFDFMGEMANVQIECQWVNKKGIYETFLHGKFDFENILIGEHETKIPLYVNNLQEVVKSERLTKIELEKTVSIDNKSIDPIKPITFKGVARPLPLDSKLQTTDDQNSFPEPFKFYGMTSKIMELYHGIPTTIKYKSDNNIQASQIGLITESKHGRPHAAVYINDSKETRKLNIEMFVSASVKVGRQFNLKTSEFRVSMYIYNITKDNDNRIKHAFVSHSISTLNKSSFDFTLSSYKGQIELKPYQYLTFVFELVVVKGDNITTSETSLSITDIDSELSIKETKELTTIDRTTKAYLTKDVGNQIMRSLTGENGVYQSEYLTNGEFKHTALTSGLHIRSIPEATTKISIKDFLQHCKSLYAMGYNIETLGGKQIFRHEHITYFFRHEVGYVLPYKITNVTKKSHKAILFSGIETGYKKPSGDILYEEVYGLEETNTQSEFNTPITKGKKYNNISPFRADSSGKELTYRKHYEVAPNEDYRTDDTIFNLDLKHVSGNEYKERFWYDDFIEPPKGIYHADTATNLRFTPAQNMERQFPYIKCCLIKHQDKYITHVNSKLNQNLELKKSNTHKIRENQSYLIRGIETQLFSNELISFTHPVSPEYIKWLNGFKIVNNKRIPNTYFSQEIKHPNGTTQKAFLLKLNVADHIGTFEMALI